MNDLWRYDVGTGQWTWMVGSKFGLQQGTYGTLGIADPAKREPELHLRDASILAPGNTPGGRFFLTRWVAADGNLWLFGGYGEAAGTLGNPNDLWMYMPSLAQLPISFFSRAGALLAVAGVTPSLQ